MLTSFLGWVLGTVHAAAEAEMNDESRLREALLEAEMRREAGDLAEEDVRQIEADVLAQIRVIRDRRTGGAEPLTMSRDASGVSYTGRFEVETSITGDFHDSPVSSAGATPSSTRGGPRRSVHLRASKPSSRAARRVRRPKGAPTR
jgi:hypothetical protein